MARRSWNDVPTVPPELILLPRWFPVHLSKMSYWARTVIVPLLVLCAQKPLARNPRGIHVAELFVPGVPAASPRAPHQSAGWSAFFGALDRILKDRALAQRRCAPRAIEKCRAWTTERLNGEDGLGAIYPAMANSVMMYDVLGYPPEHPDRAIARKSVEKLLVVKDDEAYCQPCVSPVWDTALVAHALLETKDARGRSRGGARAGMAEAAAGAGCERRLGRGKARCAPRRLGLPVSQRSLSRPGRYRRGGDGDGPRRRQRDGYKDAIARGANGWKACRAGMAAGAPSMPTTAITISTTFPSPIMARCWTRRPKTCRAAVSACWRSWAQDGRSAPEGGHRLSDQAPSATDGSWWGRWGVNYIYGTWSALAGLNGAGLAPDHADHEDAAPTGWSQSRIRTAAGARIATATSWITRAMSPRLPPRHRPPGRCWA